MKFVATATVRLRSANAADVAMHALSQHGETKMQSTQRVTLSTTVRTSSLEMAVAMATHSVRYVLTEEAGFEQRAFQLVAVSAEVV